MDAIERIKDDLRKGRIDPERLVEVLEALQRALDAAKRRIAELEKKLGITAATKIAEPFSLRAEERRQEARGEHRGERTRAKRRGRVTTAEKVGQAERTERVFPAGVAESDCRWSHTRPVWRLENGRAVLVAYEVYRGPKNQFGKIPGTLGRSEFGIEIVMAIAYQVYVVGLSSATTRPCTRISPTRRNAGPTC